MPYCISTYFHLQTSEVYITTDTNFFNPFSSLDFYDTFLSLDVILPTVQNKIRIFVFFGFIFGVFVWFLVWFFCKFKKIVKFRFLYFPIKY